MDAKWLQSGKATKALLALFSCVLMSVGQIAGPFLTRLYYVYGGRRKWLTSMLLTVGFPILILPIAISYSHKTSHGGLSAIPNRAKFLLITPRLFLASAILGILLGLDSYLYTFGVSYLPLSVSSLLSSAQLAFTAVFAFLVVKHKFTHYMINAVVLMTFSSVMLGLHMRGDRPVGESDGKYTLGFITTLMGAALHGFIMPAVEYTHRKARVPVTFDLVLQFQFLVSAFASLFCLVPMIINKDFQAIPREAKEFGLGETKYYTILGVAAISLQLMVIGSLGVIFCSTALFGGIVTSLLVPVQQVFAVFFLPESFNSEKGMALAMCLWGFASYFYGEYKLTQEKQPAITQVQELHQLQNQHPEVV